MAYPILAPRDTWYKSTSTTRSAITQIDIVDSYTPTGSENEYWDAADENIGTENIGDIKCYLTGTKLTIAGNGSGKTSMNEDSSWAFSHSEKTDYFKALVNFNGADKLDLTNVTTLENCLRNCEKLVSIDVYNWNVGNVTNLSGLFYKCYVLSSIDVSQWNTSSATTIAAMFGDCDKLITIDVSQWDVSKVESMYITFQSCGALTTLDVSNWDVSNVTNMRSIFNECGALTTLDVSNWDVSNVTNMYQMFSLCSKLKTLDVSNWNVSNVTTMFGMFAGCTVLTALDVSNWDVSSVTDMSLMFKLCYALKELDVSNWNTGKVETMNAMFQQGNYGERYAPISKLDVSNWDVSNVTDMGWMFYGLQKLEYIDVSKWDVSKVTSLHHFMAHSRLKIIGYENWNVSNCEDFNGAFYYCQNLILDFSKWNVSNGKTFSQMFEWAEAKEIRGLENWNTSNSYDFQEMFADCRNLRFLNLSSFDTTKASTTWKDPWNSQMGNMNSMFRNTYKLEAIVLGEKFSFKGNGNCTAPTFQTPSKTYIEEADGNWYDANGVVYTSDSIPDKRFGRYCASKALMEKYKTEYLVPYSSMISLADGVRNTLRNTETMTLDEMTYRLNARDTYAEGVEAGKTEMNIAIMSAIIAPEKTDYRSAFFGSGWNDTLFKPTAVIKPSNFNYAFQNASIEYSAYTDLLDFSNCLSLLGAFSGSKVKKLKIIDARKTNKNNNGMANIFYDCTQLESVDEFYPSNTDSLASFNSATFYKCTALHHFIFKSEISQGGLDMRYSKELDKESLKSVIEMLSTATTGLSVSLSLKAVNKAFETREGLNDGSTSDRWLEITGYKTNWTIYLNDNI